MTDNTILEALKKRLKEQVASQIELQKPPTEEESTVEYVNVNPYVCTGYLPPKNFLPEGYDVPCIIVGLDEGVDDGNDASLQIKLTFATYGAGQYAGGELIPDMEGYKDLLSLMTLTRQNICTNPLIENLVTIQKPIRWGMYSEQPWPYWYGYMTFSVNSAVISMINDLQNNFL